MLVINAFVSEINFLLILLACKNYSQNFENYVAHFTAALKTLARSLTTGLALQMVTSRAIDLQNAYL